MSPLDPRQLEATNRSWMKEDVIRHKTLQQANKRKKTTQGHSQAAVLGQCWPDHAWHTCTLPSSPAPVAQKKKKKQRLAAEFALPLLDEGCLLPIPVSNVSCYVYCVVQHIWQEGTLSPRFPCPQSPVPSPPNSGRLKPEGHLTFPPRFYISRSDANGRDGVVVAMR